MKFILTLALLFTCSYANSAESVLIKAEGVKAGTYYLSITVLADGSITIKQMSNIKVFNLSDFPDDPDDPDEPSDISKIEETVKNLTAVVVDSDKEKTTKAVAGIYKGVVDLVVKGKIEHTKLQQMTDTMYQSLMSNPLVNKIEEWKEWKVGVDKLVKDANLSSSKDYVDAWGEIVKGLENG